MTARYYILKIYTMKFYLPIVFLWFSLAIHAQESSWSGQYLGAILELDASMYSEVSGNQWKGKIDISGYLVEFDGIIKSLQAEGKLVDPQTNEMTPFVAVKSGETITLHIRDIHP